MGYSIMQEAEDGMAKADLFPRVNRRDFIKTCITVSAMLGLPVSMVSKVAAAAQKTDSRPAVIWLHFRSAPAVRSRCSVPATLRLPT